MKKHLTSTRETMAKETATPNEMMDSGNSMAFENTLNQHAATEIHAGSNHDSSEAGPLQPEE
jgi:hypothetical protein